MIEKGVILSSRKLPRPLEKNATNRNVNCIYLNSTWNFKKKIIIL